MVIIVFSMLKTFIILKIRSILRAICTPFPQLRQHDSERFFLDPNNDNKNVKFPSILSIPTIDISVVVPSYNEEKRCKF